MSIDTVSIDLSSESSSSISRNVLRLFVNYEGHRRVLYVPQGIKVKSMKQLVRDLFRVDTKQANLGDENQQKNILVLSYYGAELHDHWVLSDLGLQHGSTIKAFIKEEFDPMFFFHVGYKNETVPVLDRLKLLDFTVDDLRSMASRKTGLPVGVFRMVTTHGVELFDGSLLELYGVRPGDVVHIQSWDGWNNLLTLASMGFAEHVVSKLAFNDELLARFQMKVALYLAAHFGHVELAQTMLKQGCRSDEPVGEHPYRQWCRDKLHIDYSKAPVHEAVEAGQVNVLQVMIHHNPCCIMVKDGRGLQPLNLALRQGQQRCASLLLQKQYSRVRFGESSTLPLTIFARLRSWIDKSKDRVQLHWGPEKSSSKKRAFREDPLVGQPLFINGYSDQAMSSRPRAVAPPTFSFKLEVSDPWLNDEDRPDPSEFFRRMMDASSKLLPKQRSKWSRMAATKQRYSPTLTGAHFFNEESDAESPLNMSMNKKMNVSMKLPPIKEKTENKHPPNGVKQVTIRRDSVDFAGLSRRSSKASHISLSREDVRASGGDLPTTAHAMEPPEQSVPNAAWLGSKQAKRKSSNLGATLLAKAKASEGAIPLPLRSIEDTPRPFFFVRSGERNIVSDLLKAYANQRGLDARSFAIQNLAMSNSFKEKPWLHQVRMAMDLSVAGIKNPSRVAAYGGELPTKEEKKIKQLTKLSEASQ